MKLPPSHKLLKLCLTQSLLQSGFQKTTSSSLTTFTNVIEYLIFNLILKIKEIPADLACKILLKNNDFSNDIFQLLKLCKGTGESVLHVMNIIPKNMDWRGKGGGVKLIKEGGEVLESVYDDFVYEFIDHIEKEETRNMQRIIPYEMTKGEEGVKKYKLDDSIQTQINNKNYDRNDDTIQTQSNSKNHDRNDDTIQALLDNKNHDDTIQTQMSNQNCNTTQIDQNFTNFEIKEQINYGHILDKILINNYNFSNKIEYKDNVNTQNSLVQIKIDNKNTQQKDIKEFELDDLILTLTNKQGWFNDKDYKLLLENKRKTQNYLHCYNSTPEINLIDEFKFLSCKEICKVKQNSNKK